MKSIRSIKHMLILSGLVLCIAAMSAACGSIPKELTAETSADAEEEVMPASEEADIHLASRWYDADGALLKNGTVVIRMNDEVLYTGSTDDQGILPSCTFPAGQKLLFSVSDADGKELGSSTLYYAVSADNKVMSIEVRSGASGVQKILLPAGKTNITSAMYADDRQKISCANVTLNRGTGAEPAETAKDDADSKSDSKDDDAKDADAKDSDAKDSDTKDSDAADTDSGNDDDGQNESEADDAAGDNSGETEND